MKKLIIALSASLSMAFAYAQPDVTKLRATKPGGTFAAITYSTPDIEKGIDFFSHLDFKVVRTGNDDAFISDGSLLIQLTKKNTATYELTYFSSSSRQLADNFRKNGVEVSGDGIIHAEGCTIRIADRVEGVDEPTGVTFATMAPKDYMNAAKYPNKKCGVFGEWAIPVDNLDKSIAWWEQLGFETSMKSMKPYPHAIMTDGYMIIGLHQTTDFSTVTLTYFAPDMEPYIKYMRDEGVTPIKQILGTTDKNVVLTSPGEQRVFLFWIGM